MENHVSEKILDQLCHYIDQKLPPDTAEKLKQFARLYYQNVPFNDLENIAIEDLYGAMLSHWNLALRRQPDEQKIHIYNPTLENHGWQSQHTIIEIVTRDMPFLLQSVSMEINRQGLTNHLVIHPVFNFIRNEQGELLELSSDENEKASRESLLHLEIDRQTDANRHAYLKQRLSAILRDVAAATDDWPLCLKRLKTIIQTLHGQQIDQEEIDFLQWLQDDHFVFLGYREYELQDEQGNKRFVPIANTGLGILRDSIADPASQSHNIISEEAFRKINQSGVLLITKATSRSTVHRSVFMDYIGIKQFDNSGKLVGEKRILGLYNSSAYLTELKNIPLVRKKFSRSSIVSLSVKLRMSRGFYSMYYKPCPGMKCFRPMRKAFIIMSMALCNCRNVSMSRCLCVRIYMAILSRCWCLSPESVITPLHEKKYSVFWKRPSRLNILISVCNCLNLSWPGFISSFIPILIRKLITTSRRSSRK